MSKNCDILNEQVFQETHPVFQETTTMNPISETNPVFYNHELKRIFDENPGLYMTATVIDTVQRSINPVTGNLEIYMVKTITVDPKPDQDKAVPDEE